MTVNRDVDHKIWVTEMFMGDDLPPTEKDWKLWYHSYPFDSYVALREWHNYAPPYFPYPNGGSNNDPNIYWTEEHENPHEVDETKRKSITYWRAWEVEVMSVKDTIGDSIKEDNKHLTDVTQKMRQHVPQYRDGRDAQLWKPDLDHLYQDLENLVERYKAKSDSESFKELLSRIKEIHEDILDPLI